MAARGWIVRHPTPRDRRVKLLTLSAAGRKVLRQAEPAIERVQQRLLAPLTAREAEILVRLLARVAEVQVVEPK